MVWGKCCYCHPSIFIRCNEKRTCERTREYFLDVCVSRSPCTRKQKSFHMSRSVSLVKPTASYSTTPLRRNNRQRQAIYPQQQNNIHQNPPSVGLQYNRNEGRKNSHAEVTKKRCDVFSPLVIALDYILHLRSSGGKKRKRKKTKCEGKKCNE